MIFFLKKIVQSRINLDSFKQEFPNEIGIYPI